MNAFIEGSFQMRTNKFGLFQICLSNCSKQYRHTCKKTRDNDLTLRGEEP